MAKTILLVTPSNLDVQELVNKYDGLGLDPIKVKIITTLIFYHHLRYQDEVHENGFCYIHSKEFQSVVNDYSKYLDIMNENGIIERNNQYVPNEFSRQYKFSNDYFYDVPNFEYLGDTRRANKQEKNKIKEKPKKKYNYLLKWNLDENVGFDEEKLSSTIEKDFIKDLNLYSGDECKAYIKRNNTLLACESIRNKHNIWFKVDDTGYRLHTNFTNLRGSARDCLTYSGKKLIGVDIKCSQPYFSISLITNLSPTHTPIMLQHLSKTPINSDLKTYVNLILEDDIYLYYMKEVKRILGENSLSEYKDYVERVRVTRSQKKRSLQLKGEHERAKKIKIPTSVLGKEDRDIIKHMFFLVYFSKPDTTNKYKRVFKEIFPTVWDIISEYKMNDYCDFARMLQRKESSVILDKICKKLSKRYDEMPLYTVHDCIYTTEEYLPVLKGVMMSELEKATGYKPRLK